VGHFIPDPHIPVLGVIMCWCVSVRWGVQQYLVNMAAVIETVLFPPLSSSSSDEDGQRQDEPTRSEIDGRESSKAKEVIAAMKTYPQLKALLTSRIARF
jgi:hypothetical protein